MCGKYLKARQLAKEMEEKAEKTAKKKEEVKEKKKGAEKLLEVTKELDIDPGETEKKVKEGNEEIEDKNFEEAAKKFEEVIEELHEIHSDKLDEMLQSVKNFLNISEGTEGGSKLKEKIEEVENLLEEGEIKESFEKAEKIQEESEDIIEEEISEQLKNVKSLLERVEEADKKKGKAEKIVLKAEYAYEGKEYDRAISLIRDARDLIGDKLQGELDGMMGKLKTKMDRLDERGIDISKPRELFGKVEESRREKDYGKTVRYVQMCRDLVNDHFVDILRGTLEELEGEIEEAKEIGAPVREVEEMVEEIEGYLNDRKIEEAGGLLDDAFDKVKELKFEEVLNTIAESREYFIKAKDIGADISEPMKILSTARDSLQEGNYREALGLAKKGREKVQNLVKEYDKVRQKINSKEEKVKRLKDAIPIQLPKAEEIISEAEGRLQEERYEEALEVLEDFDEKFDKKAYEELMEVVEKFEKVTKVGEEIGADMEEVSEKLDEAVSRTKNSEYVEAAEIAKEGKKSSKDKIETEIEDMRKRIREEIEEEGLLDEETKDVILDLLAKSKNKLNSENYIQAHNTLNDAKEELKQSKAESSERRIEEFSELLSRLEEELETETIDTTAYWEGIEEAKEMLSKDEYKDVFDKTDHLREKLNEELEEVSEKIFGRAKMEVIRAKKTGVEIDGFRKKLIECKKNMKQEDYIEAIPLSLETEKIAKELREERKKAYENISDTASEVSKLKKEGKVEDISEIKDTLMKAKNEFREKNYSAANEMVKKADAMIKKTEGKSELKEKEEVLAKKLDKIEEKEDLSIETKDVKSDLEESSELVEDEPSKAVDFVEKASDRLDKRLEENIEERISETRSFMRSSTELGVNTEKIDSDLSKAESLLGSERYWDCLEVLSEVEKKIQDFKERHKKADENIKAAKKRIQEAEHINADSDEGKRLLDDAKAAFEEEEYEESIKKAEKAKAKIEKELEKEVEKIINEFKEKIDSYRSEEDESTLADNFIQKAKKAKEDGNYKEAINYAMQSEGELEKIELQQNIADKSISKAKQKLKNAREKDLMIDEPKILLEESIKAFKSGFYVKAFDKAVKVGNELEEISQCYEKTKSFLKNIEGFINEIEGENVEELIEVKEKISNRFKNGDYKKAYSHLSEVEKILDKNEINDVIVLLESKIDSVQDEERKREVEDVLERAKSALDTQGPIKAIELINEAKVLSGLKKKEKCKDTIEEVENLVSKAKKFGASVKSVKNKIEEAKRLMSEEGEIKKASKKAEKALDQVEEALDDYSPKIEIKALENLKLDEWNETEVLFKNKGNGVAQSPDIKINGGEIEDFELKDKLKAGEEVKISGRIKPTNEKAHIVGKALRIFDKKQLKDKYELNFIDKDKEEETESNDKDKEKEIESKKEEEQRRVGMDF